MSKEGNFLNPLGDSLGNLVKSFMDTTTDLCIKAGCKVLGTETNYIREKNMEKKFEQLKAQKRSEELEQQLKDRKKEFTIDRKNRISIDGEEYNFCDLWFNVGLTNKSKEMPILKRYQVKDVCIIFTFDCPVGITKERIEEKMSEIAAFFDTDYGNIEIRKHKSYIDIILITVNIFDELYKYDPNKMKSKEGLKTPIGIFLSDDYDVKLLNIDFTKDARHATLIAGTSGFGKSNLLRLILLHLVLNYSPEILQLVIIGGKGDNDFLFLKNSPHLYNNKIYIDMDEIVGNNATKSTEKTSELLDDLVEEVTYRNSKISKAGCVDIEDYRSKGYKDIPYKVVVFDEYSYYHSHKKFDKLQSLMGSLVQTCRSCGIKVIIALQDSQGTYYCAAIRYNTPLKFCFAASNANHSKNMCDKEGLENIRRIGEGALFAMSGLPQNRDYINFKALFVPKDNKSLEKIIKDRIE